MNRLSVLFILTLLASTSAWRIFHRGRGRNGNLGEPKTDKTIMPEEKYFDQKLDHFSPVNTLTWKQRYFVNDTFYESKGPIFLMIGGEGPASPKWMVEGTWITYAEKFKALCIMIEHRFYGKSHPTMNLDTKNLAYLSSEQALADLANFITVFNKKLNAFPNPRWIVFGGSYPGSLSAWMRLKYPHLVHGAVSTSGPLVAELDFEDYYEVVKDSLDSYNPKCVTSIEVGTKQLMALMIHPLGQRTVKKLFELCDPLDLNNEDDNSNLLESLASNFAEVVQYNKDNRQKNYPSEPDVTIDLVCDIMLNHTLGAEINRLAAVNSLLLNKSREKCLDYKYSKMIKEMSSTNWEDKVAEGERQWMYQTCTEFGFFQTSSLNSTQKMFGNSFPVKFFLKQCTDIFGANFNAELAKNGIQRTNMIYGAMDNYAENIIYVHGSIDPWHALGITKTLRKGATAIFIEGTAHCANMYPSSPQDPPQLVAARRKIGNLIGEWLEQ